MYKPLQGISPYQHNIDIIKEFFKTPLIITTAIFVILSFTLNFFSEIFYCINNINNLTKPVNLISGMVAISLFVYFLITSILLIMINRTSSSLKYSNNVINHIKWLHICSVVPLVITSILFLFISIYNGFLFTRLKIYDTKALVLIISSIVSIAFLLLLSLAGFLFIKSVKTSVNSIFLKRSGATAFGVLNIILATVCLTSAGYYIYTALSSGFTITIALKATSELCLSVGSLLMGLLSIKYSGYINKHINGQTLKHQYKATTTQQPYTPPVQNDYYVPVNQTVMENPVPAILTPEKNQHLSNNAYVRAENYNVQTVDDIASKPSPQQPKNEKRFITKQTVIYFK